MPRLGGAQNASGQPDAGISGIANDQHADGRHLRLLRGARKRPEDRRAGNCQEFPSFHPSGCASRMATHSRQCDPYHASKARRLEAGGDRRHSSLLPPSNRPYPSPWDRRIVGRLVERPRGSVLHPQRKDTARRVPGPTRGVLLWSIATSKRTSADQPVSMQACQLGSV